MRWWVDLQGMPHGHAVLVGVSLVVAVGLLTLARRWTAVRRLTDMGGNAVVALAPRLLALSTFAAGAMLLFSGATPARSGRMGWVNDLLPLPLIEASAYLGTIAGVGLIILARGLQRRLDGAYHLTVWLLAGGIVFAIASALDFEQAVGLSIMLALLLRSRRFFDRRSSILEERFTRGWAIAIAAVFVGTVVTAMIQYGPRDIGLGELFLFGGLAQGPRAERALLSAGLVLVAFGAARLIRPARVKRRVASADELAVAEPLVAQSPRASAQLAFLGDKQLLFNDARTAFIMYGISGQSWVSLGDPIGPIAETVSLIEQFVNRCDDAGGWPVFYRVPPTLLHLYLEHSLTVVKIGEVARVPLERFSLDGARRRNLRYVMRKSTTDGCTFEMIDAAGVPAIVTELARVSNSWLRSKGTREKRFTLGHFDPGFIARGNVGVVRLHGKIVAFVTLWMAGDRAEVEVDLMRYTDAAPPSIMRYALTNSILWAQAQGYEMFNLGSAPLSGVRVSAVGSAWSQMSVLIRGAGERYYNFSGIREFKEWFDPEWEPTYLISPGGVKRTVILANIASLIAGGLPGVFRR